MTNYVVTLNDNNNIILTFIKDESQKNIASDSTADKTNFLVKISDDDGNFIPGYEFISVDKVKYENSNVTLQMNKDLTDVTIDNINVSYKETNDNFLTYDDDDKNIVDNFGTWPTSITFESANVCDTRLNNNPRQLTFVFGIVTQLLENEIILIRANMPILNVTDGGGVVTFNKSTLIIDGEDYTEGSDFTIEATDNQTLKLTAKGDLVNAGNRVAFTKLTIKENLANNGAIGDVTFDIVSTNDFKPELNKTGYTIIDQADASFTKKSISGSTSKEEVNNEITIELETNVPIFAGYKITISPFKDERSEIGKVLILSGGDEEKFQVSPGQDVGTAEWIDLDGSSFYKKGLVLTVKENFVGCFSSINIKVTIKNGEEKKDWPTKKVLLSDKNDNVVIGEQDMDETNMNLDGNPFASDCHPSCSTVRMEDGTMKKMSELEIDDMVWNGDKYEKIIGFTHSDPNCFVKYLEIKTEDNNTLHISHDHYLYANGELTLPRNLKIGDVLNSGNITKISSIKEVILQGAYHPITYSSDLVVDNILCSVKMGSSPIWSANVWIPFMYTSYMLNLPIKCEKGYYGKKMWHTAWNSYQNMKSINVF